MFYILGNLENSVLEMKVQKDAAGSVSPLRVRIFGVSAPGPRFGPVFGVFRFSGKNPFWN